jgi:hypothetical protein
MHVFLQSYLVALKRACGISWKFMKTSQSLTSEAVQSAALAFQSVDDVHGGDGLALGVLAISDSVTNHVLEEQLEHTSDLFIDEARDTLDTATSSQTTDRRLGDSLDVITQHFAMTLGASLSESFASFTTSCHVVVGFEIVGNVILKSSEKW